MIEDGECSGSMMKQVNIFTKKDFTPEENWCLTGELVWDEASHSGLLLR